MNKTNTILPQCNPVDFIRKANLFLISCMNRTHFKNVVVGISGGVDSATVLSLALHTLPKQHVHVALFPYASKNNEQFKRAKNLIDTYMLPSNNIHLTSIDQIVDGYKKMNINKIRKGNILARIRMTLLFDLSKQEQALVLGTENKSEHLLGYFTRYGDEASDIELIRSIYKTQVYEVARFLDVPKNILEAPPSAGLWQGQTDEEELGFSYQEADPIIYLLVEKKYSVQSVVMQGFSRETVIKVKNVIDKTLFKHQTPYVFMG